jgi:hypothetical protein
MVVCKIFSHSIMQMHLWQDSQSECCDTQV